MVERLGWTTSPDTRGTLDILWSAFVTLALCVWTAVHPNIQPKPSQWRDLGVRLLMMLVAVIFPEILISTAWRQRVLARKLTQPFVGAHRYDEVVDQNQEDPIAAQRIIIDEWSQEQAFFVVMGGFAVQHNVQVAAGERHQVKSIFSVDGIQLMQRIGLGPQLTKDDVEERGNADIIAKLVVIMQVVWFAIQIIARLAGNLAVTSLEVHTVVHVGCAIIMYALWWNKPYVVTRSVMLEDKNSKAIGALFVFIDRLRAMHNKTIRQHELETAMYWERRAVSDSQALIDHNPPPETPRMVSIIQALNTCLTDQAELAQSSNIDRDELILQSISGDAYFGLKCILDRDADAVTVLEQPSWRGIRQGSENFTLRQIWGSWTVNTGHEMSKAKVMHFVFNLLYGAGHLAAWNSTTFPTPIEAWLWRISALIVASLFAYGSLWVLFWAAVGSRSKWLLPIKRGDLNIIAGPFFCAVMLAYIIARCYFFVEALIGLRSLPSSAYETVEWSNFLPHSD